MITGTDGEQRIFSSYSRKEGGLTYAQINEFPNLEGADRFDYSQRNRGFLITHGQNVKLQYATTGVTRGRYAGVYSQLAGIGPKYDLLMFSDGTGKLNLSYLNDPHPEAGWKAFSARSGEGQPEPQYTWQSRWRIVLRAETLDDAADCRFVERHLVRTDVCRAIAILAGIYSSQFLSARWANIIKPTMEIMASLPSVVLGFLAALWLAPILETRVPSVVLIIVLIPTVSVAFGFIWSQLPKNTRTLVPEGAEFWALIPVMGLVTWIGWELGPALEQALFVVTDEASGKRVADFRLWWPEATGLRSSNATRWWSAS